MPAQSAPPSTHPVAIEFQPGIRINWADRLVEVDATVTLREGLIELFACSPGTREYESIVVIEGRPLHVYQALGLIGLVPDHPVRHDPLTHELEPAAGDPVEILIRFPRDGTIRTEPIERWLKPKGYRDSRASPPLGRLPWVFAGSTSVGHDAITADEEGTVIALVNFSSAIVALDELHTDSNADLWLEPARESIPPVGTRCSLIFRPGPCRFGISQEGRYLLAGRVVPLVEVARRATAYLNSEPDGRFRIEVAADAPGRSRDHLRGLLAALGAGRRSIEWADARPTPAIPPSSRPADEGAFPPPPRTPWPELRRFWADTLETVRIDMTARSQEMRHTSSALTAHFRMWRAALAASSGTRTQPAKSKPPTTLGDK